MRVSSWAPLTLVFEAVDQGSLPKTSVREVGQKAHPAPPAEDLVGRRISFVALDVVRDLDAHRVGLVLLVGRVAHLLLDRLGWIGPVQHDGCSSRLLTQ